MPRYSTASYGWAFRPGSRELVKEPSGTRHAVSDGADQTLCGWYSAAALTCFPEIGFMTGRRSDRCSECEQLAQDPVRTA